MKKYLKLVFWAVIVSSLMVALRPLYAGAPEPTLELYRKMKLTNAHIPILIELVAKENHINENTYKQVIDCESDFRQYDKEGNVLLGITNDIGAAQINPWWKSKAKELGLDLNNPVDNLEMGAWIVKNDSRGWDNWVCY